MTIKQIETTIAGQLKKELNVDVNITCRGENTWTISGNGDAVIAAKWLQSKRLMTIEDVDYFDDDEEITTYVYCRN